MPEASPKLDANKYCRLASPDAGILFNEKQSRNKYQVSLSLSYSSSFLFFFGSLVGSLVFYSASENDLMNVSLPND